MAKVDFKASQVPILFNVTAAAENDSAAIRNIMAQQIASTVRWFEIIGKLMADDVRVFIEVGPKTVLSGLLKKIIPADYEYRCFQVDSPAGLDELLKEIKS